MKIIVVIVVVLSLIALLIYLFPLANVVGLSMHPTLRPNQIIFTTRIFRRFTLKSGCLYIFNHDGKKVIKRLKFSDSFGNCYFLGDNSIESYDSRYYGFVNKKNIVAKVLWFKSNN